MLALYRFVSAMPIMTAQVAALVMGLSLAVGFIAKAAISDALLNLIALSMFGIYDFLRLRDGRPTPPAITPMPCSASVS
jgi:4-amino-4-deoxy-L-arabinose transferase-like glycosyltransferase